MTAHKSEARSIVDEVRDGLEIVCEASQVYELRAIKGNSVASGYFDDLDKMAESAARLDRNGYQVYYTLNPCKPALLARAHNRMRNPLTKRDPTTADRDIAALHTLLIDCDPIRPSEVSSSEQEKAAAVRCAKLVRSHLTGLGCSEEALRVADSGNGAHLLASIDLPNDDDSSALLQRFLKALACRFNTDVVTIDETTFNPARICKVYGTIAKKGDSTEDRPHRPSRLVDRFPRCEAVIPGGLLEQVASDAPEPAPARFLPSPGTGEFDLDAFVERHLGHLITRDRHVLSGGGHAWEIDCPWNPDHKGNGFVGRRASGAIFAGCNHNSCTHHNWHELRAIFEPRTAANSGAESRQGQRRASGSESSRPSPIIRTLADVEAKKVDYLFAPYIARGEVHCLAGGPGVGKTLLLQAFATHVSLGTTLVPEEKRAPETSLLLFGEDDLARSVRPRMEAMGADLTRVHCLEGMLIADEECGMTLNEKGMEALEQAIQAYRPVLVGIDPIIHYADGKVDTNKANEVRKMLTPLRSLAEKYACAIVYLLHLSKNTNTGAIYRVQGSMDFVGFARSVLMVGKHPQDPSQRVMAHEKTNLGMLGKSRSFSVESGVVSWGDTIDLTADELLRRTEAGEEPRAIDLAASWLLENHATERRRRDEVVAAAAKDGINERTLRKAYEQLGGKALGMYTKGKRGVDHWIWPPLVKSSSEAQKSSPIYWPKDEGRASKSEESVASTHPTPGSARQDAKNEQSSPTSDLLAPECAGPVNAEPGAVNVEGEREYNDEPLHPDADDIIWEEAPAWRGLQSCNRRN